MKCVLIPSHVLEEVQGQLTVSPIAVKLVPYSEDPGDIVEAAGATGIFRWIAGERYSPIIENISTITWLHTASAGVDHVLTAPVKGRHGMVVTDSGPAFGPAIAEYVLAAMLAHARRFPEFLEQQKSHVWQKLVQKELLGATIGIIGLGPIGLNIARLAKAFGMTTLGLRRSSKPAANIDSLYTGAAGLLEMLPMCDYLIIAAALTGETEHLIGASELSQMKPDSLLVNIARGKLIDENALVDALRMGRPAAAVLDVFAQEPLPAESALWSLPNVTITPHNSFGGTAGLRKRQVEIFVDNLRRYVADAPLENVIDIDLGY